MAERNNLKKINKDRRGREVITIAISRSIENKKDINAPLTLTEINQIVHLMKLWIEPFLNTTNVRQICVSHCLDHHRANRPKTNEKGGRKKRYNNMESKTQERNQKKAEWSVHLDRNSKRVNIKGRKRDQIKKRYYIKKAAGKPAAKELLKQQIQAKAQRIRGFENRNKHFRRKEIFKEDAEQFYR